MVTTSSDLNKATRIAAEVLSNHAPKLIQNGLIRRRFVRKIEQRLLSNLEKMRTDPKWLPGVADDRTAIALAIVSTLERALVEYDLSEAALSAVTQVLVKSLFLGRGSRTPTKQFREKFGISPPSFLLISPGKGCNLHCVGCYADSDDKDGNLAWNIVDRMITEAKTLWGARFIAFSGGEPYAYRSEGKGILDLIERHPECMFLIYTNGTLITPEVSQRMAEIGNLLPAISMEGWRDRTDARRGEGVFDQLIQTMRQLRLDGVPFGVSLTGTRDNVEEILSDEFLDFVQQQGSLFGWLFQYMPIGRSFTLDLMPTPQQRVWMWRRSWEIIRNRRFLLADFWNHGTACDGCLAAGGANNGGYFAINWKGDVSPCVFLPFSPVNVADVYAAGGNLNDVWAQPFFEDLRRWQAEYKKENRNGLAPCPSRDHYADLRRLVMAHEPDPVDENAATALLDPAYAEGLAEYNKIYEALTQGIWDSRYVNGTAPPDGMTFVPLPTLPDLPDIEASSPD